MSISRLLSFLFFTDEKRDFLLVTPRSWQVSAWSDFFFFSLKSCDKNNPRKKKSSTQTLEGLTQPSLTGALGPTIP